MVQEFKTSFIPKKSNKVERRRRSRSLFMVIAVVLFVLSLVAAVGVFFYGRLLENGIERKKESLERARAAFEPALIEELSRLDTRLKSSRRLLDEHIAPSGFFDFLEKNTVQTIRFEVVNYVFESGEITITMEGEGASFNAVAVQADVFGKNNAINTPLFENLNLNQVGNVTFSFSGFLNPNTISYTPNALVIIPDDGGGDNENGTTTNNGTTTDNGGTEQ